MLTIDVSSLYTNISPVEGVEEIRKFLLDREDTSVPNEFLVRMLELFLGLKIFEFDKKLYNRIIGTAMVTVCAPPYANVFMSKIDNLLQNLARNISNNGEDPSDFSRDFWMIFSSYGMEQLQNSRNF